MENVAIDYERHPALVVPTGTHLSGRVSHDFPVAVGSIDDVLVERHYTDCSPDHGLGDWGPLWVDGSCPPVPL